MTNKINAKDIDIEHLDEIAEDEFFETKERITKHVKSAEESKDNFGHKKASKRIQKPQ